MEWYDAIYFFYKQSDMLPVNQTIIMLWYFKIQDIPSKAKLPWLAYLQRFSGRA